MFSYLLYLSFYRNVICLSSFLWAISMIYGDLHSFVVSLQEGDYLDFLKCRSLISRNWGFLENCFSISRFSFFSLVGLFFSIKTNNSNLYRSFIILTLHCSQIHLYHREQIVQHKKEGLVFLCLVGGSLRHRGLKSKIYH